MKQKLVFCSGGIMDRREEKTIKAIYDAFNNLLIKKNFSKITIQNIIDEANIGRSTFYLHFSTKEELLDVMCDTFFSHIIDIPTSKEETHDFTHSELNLENMTTHIFYHLRDSSSSVHGLLRSDISHIFYNKLEEIFISWCKQKVSLNNEIPKDLALAYISGNFITSCKWFVNNNFQIEPKTVANYFLKSIKNNLF